MLRRALPVLAAAAVLLLFLGAGAADAAATWLTPRGFAGAGIDSVAPRVAMSDGGDSVVVWEFSESFLMQGVEAVTRPSGGEWGAPVVLAPGVNLTTEAQVAIDAAGEAMAVWVTTGAEAGVNVATWAPGRPWSAPLRISAPGSAPVRPTVAADPAGDFTVAWADLGASHSIAVDTRSANGAWAPPTVVTGLSLRSDEPQVTADANGDATVVWRNEEKAIEASSRAHDGAWGAPVKLSDSGQYVREPRVAMNARGEAVAVWVRSDGSHYLTQAASMSTGGGWAKAVDVSRSGYETGRPRVVLDSQGEATAVWESFELGVEKVETSSRAPSSAWSAPSAFPVLGEEALSPSLAIGAGDETVAAWGDFDGEREAPVASVRAPGGAWGSPQRLVQPGYLGYDPQVGVDAYGDAVAAWEPPEFEGIEAAGFDGAGPQLSAVSIPGTGKVGTPLAFSLKATDVWSPLTPPSWSFADGATAAGFEVTHAFPGAGDLPVSVTVADTLGNSTTATGSVAVEAPTAAAAAAAGRGVARVRRVAFVRNGRATLRLRCGGDGPCAGVLRLLARVAPGSKRRRPTLVGKASFQIGTSGHRTVRLRLRRNVLPRLRHSPVGRLGTMLRGSGVAPGKVILREVRHGHPRHHG